MRPVLPLLALLALAATPLPAQDTDDAGEAPEEDPAAAEAEAPPPPDYNGTAQGTLSGSAFSVPVVCTIGDGGTLTAQSDPGGDGQDTNGDGTLVDVTASPDGTIAMSLMANNISFDFDDDTALLEGRRLAYAVTIAFVGGGEDVIDYTVTCD